MKPKTPIELYQTYGTMTIQNVTEEQFEQGAIRQWKRIHDPHFVEEEMMDCVRKIIISKE